MDSQRVMRSHAHALIGAAAHDLNNELTVILSAVQCSLSQIDSDDPARVFLLDAQKAAQRASWKVGGLLVYSARDGLRPTTATFESLLEQFQ